MENDSPERRMRSAGAAALVVATFGVSLWIRHAFPVFALGPVFHDDALFVKLATHLCDGRWLGPYDNLTLAKGAALPAFVCLAHAAGVPLKLAEHAAYLGAALYFSWVVGALWRSRAAMLVLFAVLAFNPLFWAPEVGGRVVRENLYQSLSLLLVALCLRAYGVPRTALLASGRIATLAAIGAVGAIYWLTREEGVWLLPSLVILAAWGVYEVCMDARLAPRRRVLVLLVLIGVPSAVFAAGVGAVNAINLWYYHTFRNNDFRSGDFQSAYGALARIRHDRWVPHVVFPLDARERAYSASAAARELQPYLEGEAGEMWRQTGCALAPKSACPEIPSGWFVWAFRDATAAAGHYASAPAAERYYRDLAREVNAACDTGTIACGPAHASLIPPWRREFVPLTWAASRAMFFELASLGNPRVYIAPSMGPEKYLLPFRRTIHGPLARAEDTASDDVRIRLARLIARVQVGTTSIALPTAIVGWLGLLVLAIRRSAWDRGHLLVAALLAAIAARVVLLGFLEATSIPVNRTLYPAPAVPMALAFAPCVIFLAFAQVSRRARGKSQ